MKIRLDINSVAVKQLESAIWMYAYNYDEVAVHTIAGAAFEIYTKRLGLSSFNEDIQRYINPEKAKEFISLWNKSYNYFKHGEHNYDKLDCIEYSEETVEIIIYLSAQANLNGEEPYRLSCARIYMIYYGFIHPELFDESVLTEQTKIADSIGVSLDSVKNKKTLQAWLDAIGNTFLNGTNSPFRNINKETANSSKN